MNRTDDLVSSLMVTRLSILATTLLLGLAMCWSFQPESLLSFSLVALVAGVWGLMIGPGLVKGQLTKTVEAWGLAFLDLTLVTVGVWIVGSLLAANLLAGGAAWQRTSLSVVLGYSWKVAVLAVIFVLSRQLLTRVPKLVGRRVVELTTFILTIFLLAVLGGLQLQKVVHQGWGVFLAGSLVGLGLGGASYFATQWLYAKDLDQLDIAYASGLSSLLPQVACTYVISQQVISVGNWMALQHLSLSLWLLHREGSRDPLSKDDVLGCGDNVVAERK
ncbi:MAG: hypothetical protein Q8N84_01485 [bacterium]|nr:hypothetical protein [bacterium]